MSVCKSLTSSDRGKQGISVCKSLTSFDRAKQGSNTQISQFIRRRLCKLSRGPRGFLVEHNKQWTWDTTDAEHIESVTQWTLNMMDLVHCGTAFRQDRSMAWLTLISGRRHGDEMKMIFALCFSHRFQRAKLLKSFIKSKQINKKQITN